MSRSLVNNLLPGLIGLLISGFAITAAAQEFVPRHPATHILRSGGLTVEVMDPNAPDRYNRGVRFSPVANVLRAVLNGKEFLHSPVDHDPETENGGLANEFDIDSPGGPPGFWEAAIGEPYVKVGVGIMRKTCENYDSWRTREVIQRAPTTAQWSDDRASFEQICDGVNGYAYKLTAEVFVKEPVIQITYHLTNTGAKSITTEHYTHNYFSFSGAPVGPGYEARFPYDFEFSGMEKEQRREGRTIFYEKAVPKPMNIRVPTPINYWADNTVVVRHSGNGQEIEATTKTVGAQSARTFLHASGSYICPEQFVLICLEPGVSAQWTRYYELSVKK